MTHVQTNGNQPCRASDKNCSHAGQSNPAGPAGWVVSRLASLFVSIDRSRFVTKATALLIVISILLLAFSHALLPCFHPGTIWTSALFSSVQPLPQFTRAITSPYFKVFEVDPPVLTGQTGELELRGGYPSATVNFSDGTVCQQTLAVHSFASSYNEPFVGQYIPPTCSYNRVTWNLTVISAGRQFDRLGVVYLGAVEVFRTSTAEPTKDGIEWTYLKDMTTFRLLFKDEQTIIFDLGNLINHVYTASFNVTLTASYFLADDSIAPADIIVPISDASAAAQDLASVFTVPPQIASNNLTLPRNTKKAIFTIAATGQDDEEFWWNNALESDVKTFPRYGRLYGYSPFREVQLLIDDQLAGVAWPFPVIFTGGVVPGLWRPIVGINVFDLREDEIDVTPWLPLLCDGQAHNFSIRISGLVDHADGTAMLSNTTESYWWVTGKLFLWLDVDGHVTTGTGPHVTSPAPEFQVSSSVSITTNGTNETLLYAVNAQRSFSVRSTIDLSDGPRIATWNQSLSFSNVGNISAAGFVQINDQHTYGYDASSSGYMRQFHYPLFVHQILGSARDNISIVASVDFGKDVKTLGQPVFPSGLEDFSDFPPRRFPKLEGAWLKTSLNGSATYLGNQTSHASFSFGTTQQEMVFKGFRADVPHLHQGLLNNFEETELFHRFVKAVNSTLVTDENTTLGLPIGIKPRPDSNNQDGLVSRKAYRRFGSSPRS